MLAKQLTLALVQFNPFWEKANINLDFLSQLINNFTDEADVFVLPEAFATGFSMNAQVVSQKENDSICQWMINTAKEKDAAVCGSVFIDDDGSYFNRFVWVYPNGEMLTYNKRHLFSLGGEHKHYARGEKQLVIDYKGWRIFPQICYDLRFPVWSRNTQAYDLTINVANWPAARFRVWKTLLKARAIENQCYTVGVNRIGFDGNNIKYKGRSMAINYKGETLFNAKLEEGVFTVKLDKNELEAFKQKFDTLKDRDLFELT